MAALYISDHEDDAAIIVCRNKEPEVQQAVDVLVNDFYELHKLELVESK